MDGHVPDTMGETTVEEFCCPKCGRKDMELRVNGISEDQTKFLCFLACSDCKVRTADNFLIPAEYAVTVRL